MNNKKETKIKFVDPKKLSKEMLTDPNYATYKNCSKCHHCN